MDETRLERFQQSVSEKTWKGNANVSCRAGTTEAGDRMGRLGERKSLIQKDILKYEFAL